MKRLSGLWNLCGLGLLLGVAACSNQPVSRDLSKPLTTVSSVELNRYLGSWYEIYRLPNWFEDSDCNTVTANYSIRDDGNIKVLNTCHKISGKKDAEGIAKIVDTTTNSKLKVSFFRPFYGDYWIVDLAPDYSWALIGEASGKYFWILARAPKLDASTEQLLLQKARNLGYLTERFVKPENSIKISN